MAIFSKNNGDYVIGEMSLVQISFVKVSFDRLSFSVKVAQDELSSEQMSWSRNK